MIKVKKKTVEVITFGQKVTDYINQMTKISKWTSYKKDWYGAGQMG
jgi:hypothetical protein